MNEEEKKAMGYFYNLRVKIDECHMLFDEDLNIKCGTEMIINITNIFKLIEKLQKENKILKEKNKKMCNEYCPFVQKIKDKIGEKEWAIESYDCDEADYKQSQAIGAWSVLQELIKEK